MEVKNYNDPWFPKRDDGTLDEDALRLPFAAYHDAIGHALDAGDIFSAVGIQADIEDVRQQVGFYAWGERTLSSITFPRKSRRAVDYMKRTALGGKRGTTPFRRTLYAWRSENPNGVLLLAPYIVKRCDSIEEIAGNEQAARQFYFERGDAEQFMYTQPAVLTIDGRLPISRATYFTSAWLFGLPESIDVTEAQYHARLIAIQYQMSWGYPSMIDQHRASHKLATLEHTRADASAADASSVRQAAVKITRGIGYLRQILTSAEELVKKVDPLQPDTEALDRAASLLMDRIFPAHPTKRTHHLDFHLGQSPEDKRDLLVRIDQMLEDVVRDCGIGNPDDESLPVVVAVQARIAELRTPAGYDRALAHAMALACGTLLLVDQGTDVDGWLVLEKMEMDVKNPKAFFKDSVVRVHQLRSGDIDGVKAVTVEDRHLVFSIASGRPVEVEKLKVKMLQHWAQLQDRDDGEWSKVFASLLRGTRNSDDVAKLTAYADKDFCWDNDRQVLKLRVAMRRVAQ